MEKIANGDVSDVSDGTLAGYESLDKLFEVRYML